jgi:septation ring formation regulator EzrA
MATKSTEKRISGLEEIIDDIPRLINMRFSFMRAQLDALDARMGTVEVKVDGMRADFQGLRSEFQGLKSEMQALPRVLAEMLDERAKRGG